MKNYKLAIYSLICFTVLSLNAQARTPQILDGEYDVELTIPYQVFQDKMTIHGVNGPIGLVSRERITGEFTVPGVFKVPLEGKSNCNLWIDGCYIEFTIMASEQGRKYPVYFRASMLAQDYEFFVAGGAAILRGQAFLENHIKMGGFVATQVDSKNKK